MALGGAFRRVWGGRCKCEGTELVEPPSPLGGGWDGCLEGLSSDASDGSAVVATKAVAVALWL